MMGAKGLKIGHCIPTAGVEVDGYSDDGQADLICVRRCYTWWL